MNEWFIFGIIVGIVVWNIPRIIEIFTMAVVGSHIVETFSEYYPPIGLLASDDALFYDAMRYVKDSPLLGTKKEDIDIE